MNQLHYGRSSISQRLNTSVSLIWVNPLNRPSRVG